MSLTEEEKMDRAGSEKLPETRIVMRKTPGVKNIQRTLASIGIPVKQTGALDQETVDAINSIFKGWDDAPSKLRGGNLTAHDIAKDIGAVARYINLATGGAKSFEDLPED